jgi:cytochrome c-type biogenesis protein
MPCVGPVLAGVIALAGVLDAAGSGAILLAAYSLGLAVPFLAVALGVAPLLRASAALQRAWRPIEITAGMLLVALGVLFFFDRFTLVAGWLAV